MTALKDLRRDLGTHLAAGLDASHAPLGAQVNPPAVVVRSAEEYVVASTYCHDTVLFEAIVITKPGDLPAVMDALDDYIDQVRGTLAGPSAAGHRFGFRGVSGQIRYVSGDQELPAVVVTVAAERDY